MEDRRKAKLKARVVKLVEVDAQLKPTAAVLLRDKAREYRKMATNSTDPAEATLFYAMSTVLGEVAFALAASKDDGVA